MYNGDKVRKDIFVEYGFRFLFVYDNRLLIFEEFEEKFN